MKVLWVLANAGLYDEQKGDHYGGTGWVGALYEQLLKSCHDINLGLAFLYNKEQNKDVVDNVTFYPIKNKKPAGLKKLLYYWKNYKKRSEWDYYKELTEVIEDFKPDVIHLWGVENNLATATLIKDVPVVVHLQGLLSLIQYSYYPYGINEYSYRLNRFSVRENIFNNGIVFLGHEMSVRAEIEKKYLQSARFVMGRTSWDKKVAKYNNPQVNYFHVNEMLRKEYYNANPWNKKRGDKFIIYSTLSDTIYKGLDVIMKIASIMIEYNYFDFEWRVAGIEYGDFVRFFEANTGLKISNLKIKMLGYQTPAQMIQGLQGSDIYVHPSYIDNSPNSLCEAQYIGVPIVSTNVGGVSTLIEHGRTGLLVPANAPYDMAFAIKDCYDNENKWRDWAANGKNIAYERHNPEKIIKDVLEVYKFVKNHNAI